MVKRERETIKGRLLFYYSALWKTIPKKVTEEGWWMLWKHKDDKTTIERQRVGMI